MRMIEFLSLLAHILVSPFKTRARLEAEIILLRHRVNVLRRRLYVSQKGIPHAIELAQPTEQTLSISLIHSSQLSQGNQIWNFA